LKVIEKANILIIVGFFLIEKELKTMTNQLSNYIRQKSSLYYSPRSLEPDEIDYLSNQFAETLSDIPPYYGDFSKTRTFLANQIEDFLETQKQAIYYQSMDQIKELVRSSLTSSWLSDPKFQEILADDYPDLDTNSTTEILDLIMEEIEELYEDNGETKNLAKQIKILGAIHIGNEETFNTEWSEIGDFLLEQKPEDVESYTSDSPNALAQLLHAANYPVTALAEALSDDNSPYQSDPFIQSIITHLESSDQNSALIVPIEISLADLFAYANYDGPLTLPKDVKNLSFHSYLFGAGSTGVDEGIQLPKDVKIEPNQWTFVPDGLFPYDIQDVIGYDAYNDQSFKSWTTEPAAK
jgi:hypothetical protein